MIKYYATGNLYANGEWKSPGDEINTQGWSRGRLVKLINTGFVVMQVEKEPEVE